METPLELLKNKSKEIQDLIDEKNNIISSITKPLHNYHNFPSKDKQKEIYDTQKILDKEIKVLKNEKKVYDSNIAMMELLNHDSSNILTIINKLNDLESRVEENEKSIFALERDVVDLENANKYRD